MTDRDRKNYSWDSRPKPSTQPRIKLADRLWQQCIGHVWGYTCARCRVIRTEDGVAHHLHSRTRKDIRWHLLNGVWLCQVCHCLVHADPKAKAKLQKILHDRLPDLWQWHVDHSAPVTVTTNRDYVDHAILALRGYLDKHGRREGDLP